MNRKRRKQKSSVKVFLICFLIAATAIVGIRISKVLYAEYQKYTHPLQYQDIVEKYSKEYNVPKTVIYAVIKTESNFKPNCTSSAGACGLMQLMPETFEWLVSKNGDDIGVESIFDEEINIKYGTYYLSYLFKNLGVWENVYSAYNAGLSRTKEWLSDPEYSKDGVLINIPIKETSDYLQKVKTARENYMKYYEMGEISNGAE